MESEQSATRNVREPPRPIRSQSLGRLRRTSGAGRAPAWYPTAFRRRLLGAARHGPRRRRWWNVMSRRPDAAYRVIDEEELLGGSGAYGESHRPPSVAAASGSRPRVRTRRRRPFRKSWGSTLASGAGLAGIAAVLLFASSHAPETRPKTPAAVVGRRSSRPDLGAVLRAKAPTWAPVPRPVHQRIGARHPSTRHAQLARASGSLHISADRSRSSAERRGVRATVAPRQRVTAAAVAPARSAPDVPVRAAPAKTGPAAEFGFER